MFDNSEWTSGWIFLGQNRRGREGRPYGLTWKIPVGLYYPDEVGWLVILVGWDGGGGGGGGGREAEKHPPTSYISSFTKKINSKFS